MLTRMKYPLAGGAAYLGLYYSAVAILVSVFEKPFLNGLTIFGAFVKPIPNAQWIGVLVQVGLILALLTAMEGRLTRRPAPAQAS